MKKNAVQSNSYSYETKHVMAEQLMAKANDG